MCEDGKKIEDKRARYRVLNQRQPSNNNRHIICKEVCKKNLYYSTFCGVLVSFSIRLECDCEKVNQCVIDL